MKASRKLIIDIVAAVVYLITANPGVTGLLIHEWLSLGLVFIFLVHCAVNYDWIANTIKRHGDTVSIANLVFDAVILITFMVVTVSGIFVSRHILPLAGYVAPGYFFWNPVHSISAKVLLALLVVHVVIHLRWFSSLRGRGKASRTKRDGAD